MPSVIRQPSMAVVQSICPTKMITWPGHCCTHMSRGFFW